jgi:hypothetical protein
LPSEAGTRSDAAATLITAMSVSGSVPTTAAFLVVPSLKLTEIEPSLPTPDTTWLLVRISPSLLSTMPEPEPEPDWPVTLTLTTEGRTALATFSTVPSWITAVLVASNFPEVPSWTLVAESSLKAWKAAEPPTPAAPPRTSAPTSTAAVRPRPRCAVALGGGAAWALP